MTSINPADTRRLGSWVGRHARNKPTAQPLSSLRQTPGESPPSKLAPPMPSARAGRRGPRNDLHKAAGKGSVGRVVDLLSRGSIDIDQGDPQMATPLMFAAVGGCSAVVRILLGRGANLAIVDDNGCTALHTTAHQGHLDVAVDLIEAGADLEVATPIGNTPLSVAAQEGHSEVMKALIEAGANVDSLATGGWTQGTSGTPPYCAAVRGHVGAVRVLLRSGADPLLITTPTGRTMEPLAAAAQYGHVEVVREFIRQVGIEGCGGLSGGHEALCSAADKQQVRAMAALTAAGVVDAFTALHGSACYGREASVKFLLQAQAGRATSKDAYVDRLDRYGRTLLVNCVHGCPSGAPRIVRMLIDAGADTGSIVRLSTPTGREGTSAAIHGTALMLTIQCLSAKRVKAQAATEEQMNRLMGVGRLLARVPAVRAVSWLWPSDAPAVVGGAAEGARKAKTSSSPLTRMMPILRRRNAAARRVLLADLFR